MEKFNQIIQAIQDWFGRLTVEQKRLFAIIGTIVFSSILTIAVLMSLGGTRQPRASLTGESDGETGPQGPQRLEINVPIPMDELFIPNEPDYIPGVILEREQKTEWSEEDALSYWQDPLGLDEEQWREKIETAIDEFLERVP